MRQTPPGPLERVLIVGALALTVGPLVVSLARDVAGGARAVWRRRRW